MPYWNIQHGTTAVLASRHAVTEVSPWTYGLNSAGQIDTQYSAGQAVSITGDIRRLRVAGKLIVPSISNITGGQWSYPPVGRMLHSPALMAQQVAAIVALVQRNDYAAIGRAADQVRLMGYDYHWDSSPPGPVAPVSWIRAVLRYAKTRIPASKIILGAPLYGYGWSGGHGTPISWLQALRLSRRLVRLAESLTTGDVAVLIPAHNEALVIEESLRSIMVLVPSENVHVVSDGSTDATVDIARARHGRAARGVACGRPRRPQEPWRAGSPGTRCGGLQCI